MLASKKSLRPDPNFDALIRILFPNPDPAELETRIQKSLLTEDTETEDNSNEQVNKKIKYGRNFFC